MAKQDRKVAEWVLFEGGELSLEGDPARIQDVSALPSGDFFIETLDLVGTLIEPPQLERISGLTRLRNLYLAGPMWNRNADDGKDHSADLRAIAGITSLERITFSYHFLDRTRFRDTGLTAIDSLTNLRELSVRQANVRGHSLGRFRKLQVLDITLAPVDDDGIRSVAGMPDLQRLWAGDTLVTDSGVSGALAPPQSCGSRFARNPDLRSRPQPDRRLSEAAPQDQPDGHARHRRLPRSPSRIPATRNT